MKYKVNFSGFAYIEADNEEEAEEYFNQEIESYRECGIDSIQEVDDFVIRI